MRSHVQKGCLVVRAMERRLGPIFNAAKDAVEPGSQQNESR